MGRPNMRSCADLRRHRKGIVTASPYVTQNLTSVDRQRLPCGTARSSSRALLTGTRALWGYR